MDQIALMVVCLLAAYGKAILRQTITSLSLEYFMCLTACDVTENFQSWMVAKPPSKKKKKLQNLP